MHIVCIDEQDSYLTSYIFCSIGITISTVYPPDCIGFLDRLLQLYPERRISASDALQHAWVRSYQEQTPRQQNQPQQQEQQQQQQQESACGLQRKATGKTRLNMAGE